MNKGIAVMLVSSLLLSSCANRQETKVIKPINHNVTNFPLISFKKFEDVSNKLKRQQEIHKQEAKKDKGYVYEFDALVTAYCASETPEDDPTYNLAADGTELNPGETISMDKSIPFGTIVHIDSLGDFVVHDRGRLIHQNHIDLLVKSSRSVDTFGKKYLRARILKWGDGKRHVAKNND